MPTSIVASRVLPAVCALLMAARGLAAATPSRLDHPGSDSLSDVNVTFPTTPVGQTSSFCVNVCFSQPTSPPGTCDGSGTITLDRNVAAPFLANNYLVGAKTPSCSGTPVTLPTNLSAGQVLWFELSFSPTHNGNFSDTLTLSGLNFDLSGSTGSQATGCTPNATTLCIDQNPGDSRFMVQVSFHTTQGGGFSGSGNAIGLSSLGVTEGGLFWFFTNSNPEMLIKVLDGCTVNSHFWVFFAATTNVGFTVTVTDTQTGHQAIYTNADKHAASPVQDTVALTCP